MTVLFRHNNGVEITIRNWFGQGVPVGPVPRKGERVLIDTAEGVSIKGVVEEVTWVCGGSALNVPTVVVNLI